MLVIVLSALTVVALTGSGQAWSRVLGQAPTRSPRRPGPPRAPLVEDPRRRIGVCVSAGVAIGWALFGTGGLPLGGVVGLGVSWSLGRLEPPSQTRRREQVRRDLPLAVDLLAACADVGLPPARALRVVAHALPGPLGERLAAVAARLSLGVDPVDEWQALMQDEQLAPLARTVVRSLESGAPLAAGLTRLAVDRRRDLRTVGQVKARRVGVQAAGPLGLCFLPAFMLIGVVPTVVGTFSDLVLG